MNRDAKYYASYWSTSNLVVQCLFTDSFKEATSFALRGSEEGMVGLVLDNKSNETIYRVNC